MHLSPRVHRRIPAVASPCARPAWRLRSSAARPALRQGRPGAPRCAARRTPFHRSPCESGRCRGSIIDISWCTSGPPVRPYMESAVSGLSTGTVGHPSEPAPSAWRCAPRRSGSGRTVAHQINAVDAELVHDAAGYGVTPEEPVAPVRPGRRVAQSYRQWPGRGVLREETPRRFNLREVPVHVAHLQGASRLAGHIEDPPGGGGVAIGFCSRTALPARRHATAISSCVSSGVVMITAWQPAVRRRPVGYKFRRRCPRQPSVRAGCG